MSMPAARGEPLGKTRLVGDPCELRSQKSTEGFIRRSTSASTGLSVFLISRLAVVTKLGFGKHGLSLAHGILTQPRIATCAC